MGEPSGGRDGARVGGEGASERWWGSVSQSCEEGEGVPFRNTNFPEPAPPTSRIRRGFAISSLSAMAGGAGRVEKS